MKKGKVCLELWEDGKLSGKYRCVFIRNPKYAGKTYARMVEFLSNASEENKPNYKITDCKLGTGGFSDGLLIPIGDEIRGLKSGYDLSSDEDLIRKHLLEEKKTNA